MRKVIDATSQPRASTQKSSLRHRKTAAALSASTANLAQTNIRSILCATEYKLDLSFIGIPLLGMPMWP
ncbi:hypothetical protein ARZXY2_2844 [Arthrobacter sp. ZXY-2]|nr:hypothetical protein ARZXY2_2844 [Arthrobacter sp. ZXY-2]